MGNLITTTEAARTLGVSPSTLKRWAEEGVLECQKTPGGHRRFRRDDVNQFLHEQLPVQCHRHEDEALVRALVRGLGVRDVVAVFRQRQTELGSCWAAAESFAGVLVLVGEWWSRGLLTVVQEHQASETLERAFNLIASDFISVDRDRLAVLALAEGEEHGLGLNLAEIVFREHGYRVLYAGRMTPIPELAVTLEKEAPDLLAVAASSAHGTPEDLHRQQRLLEASCHRHGTTLLLGGSGDWDAGSSGSIRLTSLEQLHQWLARRDRVPLPLSSGSS